MANYQKNLNIAVNKLSAYFGLRTNRELASQIALSQLTSTNITSNTTVSFHSQDDISSLFVSSIIDTSEGCYLTKDVVKLINNSISQHQSPEVIRSIGDFVEIYGPKNEQFIIRTTPDHRYISFNEFLQLRNNNINSNPEAPSKEKPNLVVYKVNHAKATPANKNINPAVIFLNGVPNIELARAVPYLDIKLVFPGPPISTSGRLQNTSLLRFLEGNAQINTTQGNTKTLLTLARDKQQNSENTTISGIELFTSPQTLVNADETYNESTRINRILDKFQPLMTLKSLDIDIAPSTGIMSFKTAKLSFTLHDRSRLAEISDLIRPDLYSRSELLIEYGWAHPEAAKTSNITNYYAELINAMRAKEKYGIINSSLNMNESGQVEITLELAMRGFIDMQTEFISSDEDGSISRIINTIRDLETTIGYYRRRVFGQNAGASNTEVRGIQILDAAEDARSHLLLDSNLRTSLQEFRQALSRGGNANEQARQLSKKLDDLYGRTQGQNNGGSSNGSIAQLRRAVQDQIRSKLIRLTELSDPILRIPTTPSRGSSNIRHAQTPTNPRGNRATTTAGSPRNGLDISLPSTIPQYVSLGKLLTLFVGEPLASTEKYDEVQFLFYPFNQYAGLANGLNISSFAVDIRYFFEMYSRYRLENASRAANMNIRDFIHFLSTTLIDDHAAPSYGLMQANLFRHERNEEGLIETKAKVDAVQMQSKIEELLRSVTPDGSFRMPQVDFYIEALPQRILDEDTTSQAGDEKTILRIHIFDRQNTCYDTQGAMLAAARDDEIRTISQIPYQANVDGGDRGVHDSQMQAANAIIEEASRIGLIEPNQNETKESRKVYRIKGGTAKLKEFIMNTTPYIIFGAQGTTVKGASVTSIQDAALSTVNMLRSFQTTNMDPNGEAPGGIPMQIIPTEVGLTTFGNPLIDFAQQFFIDFQTGTSIDNIYAVVGITHKIAPGEFTSDFKMAPLDAWGKYRSLTERINSAASELSNIANRPEPTQT